MSVIRMTEEQYAAWPHRRTPTLAEMATGTMVKPATVVAEKPKRPSRAKVPKERSRIELAWIEAHKVSGLPPMVEEFKPLPMRKFRLDFSYPDKKIALECDGSVHRIKGRFKTDQERKNLLVLSGWRVLYVGMEHICSGQAVEWLKELMET